MTYHFDRVQSDYVTETRPEDVRWSHKKKVLFAILASTFAWAVLILLVRSFLSLV